MRQFLNAKRKETCFSSLYVQLSTKGSKASEWLEPMGRKTGILIYNSLTKRTHDLILPKGNILSWYICGPTVYDKSHIGHASNYVRFDIIRRILQDVFDINVIYVMNITDVDDKIIKKANELGQDFRAITSHFEREFFQELSSLNIMRPSVISRVSDNIPAIIECIQMIIKKGHAYQVDDGSVYFDVVKFGNYNKFTRSPDMQDDHVGVKRNMQDFALWKSVKSDEPYWSSPWGQGRPGWHIECSAMASRVFGSSIDIHSGGVDLMFPHHENELAQSCSFHGVGQWVNYWMHSGFLHLQHDAEKMSKSLKNIIPTSELLQKYNANQFRMFCLLTHYRTNIEFKDEKMQQAIAQDNKIGLFLQQCDAYINGQILGGCIPETEILQKLAENHEKFIRHLQNDFNTPEAMKTLFDLINMVSVGFTETGTVCRSTGVVAAVQVYIKRLCKKLGFHKKDWKMCQDVGDIREVLDKTVKFRYNVRQFALNTRLPSSDSFSAAKEQKKEETKLFAPLIACCDDFRTQLSNCKINIKDHKTYSSWELSETNKEHSLASAFHTSESKPCKNATK